MLRYFIILLFLVKIDAQLVHPVSESTLYQTHVKFEWLENPQANHYEIYISNSSDIINECIICGNQVNSNSLIFIEKDNLDWNNTYFWQINYLNINGEILGSHSDTFSIGPSLSNTTTTSYELNSQDGLTIFGSFFDYYSAVIDEN